MGIKKSWKQCRVRFYLKNLIWNYKFWLNAKPMYGKKSYKIIVNEINKDLNPNFDYFYDDHKEKFKTKDTKRFLGYVYKNKTYLDNPGIQGELEETWNAWIKKGLINN